MSAIAHVLRAGPSTTVQDAGRKGRAHLGVPGSGALDRPAHRYANRLVGNPPDMAVLEAFGTGPKLRFERTVRVAVTGAVASLTVDGRNADYATAVEVPAGSVLDVGPALRGLYLYVAVSGGFDLPLVMESRSTCTISGLGHPPLIEGDSLLVGYAGSSRPARPYHPPPLREGGPLRAVRGPREEACGQVALQRLWNERFVVTDRRSRASVHLEGPVVEPTEPWVPPEGLLHGSIVLPPTGRPMILLADHPTTGGFPVAAVIALDDLPAVAQARPGTEVWLSAWRE